MKSAGDVIDAWSDVKPFAGSAASLAKPLDAGLAAQGIALPAEDQRRLLVYLALLEKWNRVYNLSAIREPAKMLSHHILDSLSVLKPVILEHAPAGRALRLLDVGSGAGLPGIPLAIAYPTLELDLVEPVGKKAAFLRQCVLELGLAARVRVHACAVERLAPCDPDRIICRAFASLADYVQGIRSQVRDHTQVWAMKGRYPHEEVKALQPPWRVVQTLVLDVPGLDAERHLLQLTPTSCLEPEN